MKKLFFTLLGAVLCLLASAQTRSYADNASGTFVFGLERYFYGGTGTFEFEADGKPFQATVEAGKVSVGGTTLEGGPGEVVVGIHDFSGDRVPDLMVARRDDSRVSAVIYRLSSGQWIPMGSTGPVGGSEIRVFRQVISVRNAETLHSWTWHNDHFDYKSNR
ncbi:MAG: hypothetical protein K5843_06855 [Bacteroidales bacterium]|nr:hypothetical protein [Bacteroidales bacterium]